MLLLFLTLVGAAKVGRSGQQASTNAPTYAPTNGLQNASQLAPWQFVQWQPSQTQAPTPKQGLTSAIKVPDAQVQSVLTTLAAFNAPPLENTTYEVGRQLPSITNALWALSPRIEPVARVEHRIIPGPGGQLLLRLYYPQGRGPFPVLVYFHGGGFVIANLDTYDASCRALTNAASTIVVSVAYRQAPEHPFPAASDDAYAAYTWVLQNAQSFNGNPNKIAIGGESAGGNLAAGTTIKARNQNIKLPVIQLLIYPVTDFANSNYSSYTEFANAKPLNTPMLSWFGGYYLSRPTDKNDYRASPLLANNLRGLPPAFFVIADIDPLRDQAQQYQIKLQQAGVQTSGKLYYGVTHEFFGLSAVSDTAKLAVRDAATALSQAFA